MITENDTKFEDFFGQPDNPFSGCTERNAILAERARLAGLSVEFGEWHRTSINCGEGWIANSQEARSEFIDENPQHYNMGLRIYEPKEGWAVCLKGRPISMHSTEDGAYFYLRDILNH